MPNPESRPIATAGRAFCGWACAVPLFQRPAASLSESFPSFRTAKDYMFMPPSTCITCPLM
ncbi:MAG: 4Fe-4S binding protein [Prevotella sp.]|nr:4Fe-4S binding protein [Prevotella sp.]